MRALSAAPWLVAFALVSSAACQDATQFELVLTTDIPRTSVRSSAINAAPSVEIAQAQMLDQIVGAAAENCKQLSPGVAELGNIYLFPAEGKPVDSDGAVMVRVGVGQVDARACMPPLFKGCVAAKRTFRYRPQTRVNLPIKLSQECLDAECSSNLTCIAKGLCVPTDYLTIPPTTDAGVTPPPSTVRDPSFTCSTHGIGALFCKDFEDKVSPPTDMLRTEENFGALYVEPSASPGLSSLVSEMKNVSSLATASVQDLTVATRFFFGLDIELSPDFGSAVDPSLYKEIARIRRAAADTQTSILIGWANGKLRFSREANALDSATFDVPAGWHRISVEKTATDIILSVDGSSKRTTWTLPSPFGFRVGVLSGGPKRKVRYDNILVTNLQ